MDGVETTRRIRSAYPGIAILALSSTDYPEVRDGFLQAGADLLGDPAGRPAESATVAAAAENSDD